MECIRSWEAQVSYGDLVHVQIYTCKYISGRNRAKKSSTVGIHRGSSIPQRFQILIYSQVIIHHWQPVDGWNSGSTLCSKPEIEYSRPKTDQACEEKSKLNQR